jgi:hypothetical protein
MMPQASNDGKPTLKVTEKATAKRWRCSSASLRRYPRRLRYRSKILIFIYSTFYLIRHWFDFFCHPQTLDNILMGQHVPYAVSIAIFAGAVSWSWRHRSRATFWALSFTTAIVFATEFYLRVYAPDNEVWWPFSLKSPLACGLMVLSAVFDDRLRELEESSTAMPDHLEEDAEAAREAKAVKPYEASPQISPSNPRSKISALRAYMSRRLPTIGTAAAMAFIAAAGTVMKHPPTFADEWLSDINCKTQTTKLDFDNEHFQFTAANTTSTFARSCSESQQLWTLAKAMNAHVNASDATCGVWCVRRAENGQLSGYISQVRSGLVDMYYCRGGYGSFGPDCEAEGEEYGYDVGKERWMDDIFEPWSVLEEDTGETLPPDEI